MYGNDKVALVVTLGAKASRIRATNEDGMIANEQVALVYSYDEIEQSEFKWIRDYSRRVDTKAVVLSDVKRPKFMLAGLFLSYRAENHNGCNLTTIDPQNESDPWPELLIDKANLLDGNFDLTDIENDPFGLRLALFGSVAGFEIEGTDHFLKLLGFSWTWILFGIGRSLARFVNSSKPLKM